ncbi:TetR/AcrR family transcriptional regulator [Pseudonocardia lacus]|uniref:TetR/AcrR family transcriptional regulator n=1 Tax=Pseudonocardia lacus TaxID=2835865 RepID=UPI001BDC7737|nr:TetR/AcrR family transcriptional regulator [Pseudonocardia lacus]
MVSQRERSERTIAAILGAGRELMTDGGYAAVTIDDVVARARVAKGAFYHHFPSKKALLDAVVDRLQGEIADELRADRRPAPLSSDDLAAALEGYLRRAAHPARRRLVLVEGPEVLGWERWREIDDAHFAGMTRAALEAILPAGTDPRRVASATRLLLGAVMEAALATGRAPEPDRAASEYGEVLRDLLSGLVAKTDS